MHEELTTIYVVVFEPAPGSVCAVGGFNWYHEQVTARAALDTKVAAEASLPADDRHRHVLYALQVPTTYLQEPEELVDHIDSELVADEPAVAPIFDTHPTVEVRIVRTQQVCEQVAYVGHVPRGLVGRFERDGETVDLDEYIQANLAVVGAAQEVPWEGVTLELERLEPKG